MEHPLVPPRTPCLAICFSIRIILSGSHIPAFYWYWRHASREESILFVRRTNWVEYYLESYPSAHDTRYDTWYNSRWYSIPASMMLGFVTSKTLDVWLWLLELLRNLILSGPWVAWSQDRCQIVEDPFHCKASQCFDSKIDGRNTFLSASSSNQLWRVRQCHRRTQGWLQLLNYPFPSLQVGETHLQRMSLPYQVAHKVELRERHYWCVQKTKLPNWGHFLQSYMNQIERSTVSICSESVSHHGMRRGPKRGK